MHTWLASSLLVWCCPSCLEAASVAVVGVVRSSAVLSAALMRASAVLAPVLLHFTLLRMARHSHVRPHAAQKLSISLQAKDGATSMPHTPSVPLTGREYYLSRQSRHGMLKRESREPVSGPVATRGPFRLLPAGKSVSARQRSSVGFTGAARPGWWDSPARCTIAVSIAADASPHRSLSLAM